MCIKFAYMEAGFGMYQLIRPLRENLFLWGEIMFTLLLVWITAKYKRDFDFHYSMTLILDVLSFIVILTLLTMKFG